MADSPYKVIIPGENGSGDQVFYADTPEELQEKFAQAQTHATRKISELSSRLTAAEQQLAATNQAIASGGNGNGVDRGDFFQTFYEKPDDAIERVICKRLGVNSLQEVVQDYAGVRKGATAANVATEAQKFVDLHPEWNALSQEDKIREGTILGQIIEEQGWPLDNAEVMDLAYKVGLGSGKFKVLHGTVDEPPNYHYGNVPTTVTRPSSQPNVSESEQQFYQTAKSAEDIKNYILKKHGQKP